MSDNQETIDVKFKFLTENDQKVVAAFKNFAKEGAGSVAIADALQKKFAEISRETKFNKIIQDAAALKNGLDGAGKSAQLLLDGLESIGATSDEIESAARRFTEFKAEAASAPGAGSSKGGGSGANFGTIGRSLGGIGLGGVSDIANAADDVKDLFEQFKAVGNTLPIVTTATELLTPALGASAAGFAAVLLPLAPIVAVLGGVALGVKAFNDELEKNREAIKLSIEGLERETNLKNQNIVDARTRTSAENLQAANDLQQQFNNQQELIGKLQAQRKAVADEYAALGSSLNPQRRAELGDQGAALDKAIEEASKGLIVLGEQVSNTVLVLGPEVDARQKERDAIEAATKAQKEHEQAIKDTAAEQKRIDAEIAQARQQLLTVNEQIGDSEKRRADVLANRVQDEKRAGEVGVLEAKIAAAQEQEIAQDKAKKLVAIRAEGGDSEAKAIMSQQAKIDQINSTFFANQMKAWNSYYTAETRAEQQHKTDRLRQLEDLNASLLNLSASRDVAGFIQARTSGLTNIRRGDEDAGTGSRQRREDYETQAREADANRNKQLSELRAANDKENTERRNALNKRIAEEEAAGQGQLKQSEVLQQQLAALRQQYAGEDLAARRRNEDEAYTTQIGKLRNRQQELNKIISGALDPARVSIGNLANSVVSFINQIRTAASAPAPRPATISGYSNGSYTPPPASAAKGSTVFVQNANFGQIATPADVANGQKTILQAVHLATGGR